MRKSSFMAYVNQSFLWINMVENSESPANFDQGLHLKFQRNL
jgi:hypothetical protein